MARLVLVQMYSLFFPWARVLTFNHSCQKKYGSQIVKGAITNVEHVLHTVLHRRFVSLVYFLIDENMVCTVFISICFSCWIVSCVSHCSTVLAYPPLKEMPCLPWGSHNVFNRTSLWAVLHCEIFFFGYELFVLSPKSRLRFQM